MSISLSYDEDLSGVGIDVGSLTADAVQIQKSTNELHWEIVRGAVSIPPDSGQVLAKDYEFASDTEIFYRVLDVDDLEGAPLETDSIIPSLDGEVWIKSIKYSMLNRPIEIQNYSDIDLEGRAGVWPISRRSKPVGSTDIYNAMVFELIINVEEEEEVRDISLSLAVGDVFYFHMPPNAHPGLPPRSFYFLRRSHRIERWVDHDERRLLHIMVQEVLPPAPNIASKSLVWGTVFDQYGGWTSLIGANPSWGPLLESVGSPDDLVVL